MIVYIILTKWSNKSYLHCFKNLDNHFKILFSSDFEEHLFDIIGWFYFD